MKLLDNQTYKKIENLLRQAGNDEIEQNEKYIMATIEIIDFFERLDKSENQVYSKVLDVFYINRQQYKNRYASNVAIFLYLIKKLHVKKDTLYQIRKEIVYKSAMVYYKYGVLKDG